MTVELDGPHHALHLFADAPENPRSQPWRPEPSVFRRGGSPAGEDPTEEWPDGLRGGWGGGLHVIEGRGVSVFGFSTRSLILLKI